MQYIGFILYVILSGIGSFFERRRSLASHIKRLRKSGYTKTVFDVDGHTIVIQSHKHKEDIRT